MVKYTYMSFTPIGDALQSNLGNKPATKRQVEAAAVLDAATATLSELLGAELAPHAKPLFLKNRTITITCASSAVAQEIRLRQGEIVDKINEKMGGKEIDRIRYLA